MSTIIDHTTLADRLRRHLAQKPGAYGIYFQELNGDRSFGIDENELFVQASCLKLAYVLYLYEQVSAGRCTLEQRLAYRAGDDYRDGSGYLQYMAEEGDRFTLRTLARAAITLSDNIAYRMIKRFLGIADVLGYMRRLGASHPQPNGEHRTTPRDMGCYLRGVLDFTAREPELGIMLLEDMAAPLWHFGLPLLLPDSIPVAHKEGDLDGVANDVGIVFLPDRPYLLAILSRDQPDVKAGFREIARLSKMVYDFHEPVDAEGCSLAHEVSKIVYSYYERKSRENSFRENTVREALYRGGAPKLTGRAPHVRQGPPASTPRARNRESAWRARRKTGR
jgi:beta-lactamase class A